MNSFRSTVTHVLVAILGGSIALGGFLTLQRDNGSATQTVITETADHKPAQAIAIPAPAVNELKKASRAFVAIAKAVQPAVVNINTVRVIKQSRGEMPGSPFGGNPFGDDLFRRFFGDPQGQQRPQEFRRQGLGSGMIIDAKEGYILTNNHVVAEADEIKVTLADGRDFEAEVVGTDPQTDVGVVKLKSPPDDLVQVRLGDSDVVEVGDWAIAVGNPFGLSQTVTVGIISAKGRANVNVVDFEDFIQTDAAINPGNSGGPLLSVDGSVIGVNTAIFSRSGGYQGIGFTIPSNMARQVMEKLIKGEKIQRGFLGVYLQDLTKELAKNFGIDTTEGALISQVMPDSPADKAGFKTGDVVVEMDGKPVKTVHTLRNRVAFSPVGDEVKFVIMREGKKTTLTVTLGERPDDRQVKAPEEDSTTTLGVAVANLTAERKQQYRTESTSGVVVTKVEGDGLAAKVGIREGDVILEMNRTTIADIDDFKKTAESLKEDAGILFLVERQGRRLFMAFQG
jgi:serine protease Do